MTLYLNRDTMELIKRGRSENVVCAFYYYPDMASYSYQWIYPKSNPNTQTQEEYERIQAIYSQAVELHNDLAGRKGITINYNRPLCITLDDKGKETIHYDCNEFFIDPDAVDNEDFSAVDEMLDIVAEPERRRKNPYGIHHNPEHGEFTVLFKADFTPVILLESDNIAPENLGKLVTAFRLSGTAKAVQVVYSENMNSKFIDDNLYIYNILSRCFEKSEGSRRIVPTTKSMGLDIFDEENQPHYLFYLGRNEITRHQMYDLYLSGKDGIAAKFELR